MAASAKSLSSLLAQTSIDDHEEILRAANADIKKSKTNVEAHHVKAVALLHLDRYEEAVQVFEGVTQLQEKARFEYAYALYRSGDAAKAVEVAEKGDSSRAMRHVLGQAAYRTENFEQAGKVYKQLASESVKDEEYDIKINSGAVDAQLEWTGRGDLAQKKKPEREDLEVFETAYNAACGSISRGEFAQGLVCLKRAKDLCNALTELSDAEKKAELFPITVQQVYILTQLGKINEAEELATTIPFSEIKELSTRYIAQVNSIAASKEHANPYLSHRLFHSSPIPPKTDQFFSSQSNTLRQNEYVLDIMSRKVDGVILSTEKLIKASPAPTLSPAVNTASVLNAAAHAKDASQKAALKEILLLLDARPSDVGLLLTITNLYVITNNLAAATHLLESFFKRLEQSGTASDLDVRHAPGLVATLVSLYAQQGRYPHSKSELAKAATYWRHKSKSTSKSLIVAAGTALLDTHSEESLAQAGELFSTLYDEDNNDRAAIAGLVAAYSVSDPSKIPADLLSYLPDAERLTVGVDITALENAGVPSLASTATTTQTTTSRKRPAETSSDAKEKKIRKSRQPKDFDPNKKIDSERWLPLRDRTYYKPKNKKGKKKMEGLTQGGPVADEKVAESKASQGGGGGGAKKGGKKKGKGKW